MKTIFEKMKNILNNNSVRCALLFAAFVLAAIAWHSIAADNLGFEAFALVAGVAGGKHVSGEPLTLPLTEEGSPTLLRNEIDERIVKVRPMATPIDQISRLGVSRKSGSMVVNYYSVDTKPIRAYLASVDALSTAAVNNFRTSRLYTSNDLLFEPSDTLMFPSVYATDSDGNRGPLLLYVVSKSDDGMVVVAINNVNAQGEYDLPAIMPDGSPIVRMGRAAAELDVQTAQFESLPVKSTNFCQIFKTQVEQSTYQKIANKEVGWDFNDQEEAAIIDMRMGMEKNFLFGYRNRIFDPVKREEVLLTGGIWQQAGKEWRYDEGDLSLDRLVELSREAFTGNAGSSKKILVGGTMLIEQLNKLDHTKVVGASETMTRWGLDFSEIVTKFGRLYVIASEVFDQCGHASDGMIIDPEYITKYCHVPFRTERLDLRGAGVRNTDAIVITEASCLVLRYPQAHMRIIAE